MGNAVRALAAGLLLAWAGLADAGGEPSFVGTVRTVSGKAFVVRGTQTSPAQIGQRLLEGDTLRTATPGTLGVILKDDTLFSLGSETEIRLESLAFAPAQGRLGMVLKMMRGVVAYVSGKIAKLAPESVRFETPVATLGLRGTRIAAQVFEP